MYSGTSFTRVSGGMLGVHQKVNRAARKELSKLSSTKNFPSVRLINSFEGRNGPDGVKVKSPAIDEPWHYYDPFDPDDTELLSIIRDHYDSLVEGLKAKNHDKAAFEAAWLSHALVDGLTPAHHHPYEEELEEIRGESKETRTTYKEKLIAQGEKPTETLKKNWMLWGAKGLMTTHHLFEFGTAMILAPNKVKAGKPDERDIAKAKKIGLEEMFMQAARRVAQEDMYEYFYQHGWTLKLSGWIRNQLAPEMVKTTSIAWYLALSESGMANPPKKTGKRQ